MSAIDFSAEQVATGGGVLVALGGWFATVWRGGRRWQRVLDTLEANKDAVQARVAGEAIVAGVAQVREQETEEAGPQGTKTSRKRERSVDVAALRLGIETADRERHGRQAGRGAPGITTAAIVVQIRLDGGTLNAAQTEAIDTDSRDIAPPEHVSL